MSDMNDIILRKLPDGTIEITFETFGVTVSLDVDEASNLFHAMKNRVEHGIGDAEVSIDIDLVENQLLVDGVPAARYRYRY